MKLAKTDTRQEDEHKENILQLIMFSASSAITTVTDFLCFTLLYITTSNIIFSNVSARIVSATVNFTINRKMVFKDDEGIKGTAVKFFASAAAILAVKTTFLKIMVDYLGFNAYLSKGMIGAAFFLINWMVQRFIVFAGPQNK